MPVLLPIVASTLPQRHGVGTRTASPMIGDAGDGIDDDDDDAVGGGADGTFGGASV